MQLTGRFSRNSVLTTVAVLSLLAACQAIGATAEMRPVVTMPLGDELAGRAGGPSAIAVTVTGTITGPGGPAEGVWIAIGSPLDWQETSTGAGGGYGVTIETDGELWFHVRPDPAIRLTQANLWRGDVTGNVIQDFALEAGHLLSLRPTGPGYGPIGDGVGWEVMALETRLPPDQWLQLDWDEVEERYQAVIRPDVYWLTAHQVPVGLYPTTKALDLRSDDVWADFPLGTVYAHPIPYDPPDASLISVGPTNSLGEAQVVGEAGAALPLGQVLLVNLNSAHQAYATAEGDGSFTARIYAPPGSALMIKHGPASPRWGDLHNGVAEGINPFPGTIINLPHEHSGVGALAPFAAAGGIALRTDDPGETRNHVGAGWAITGTAGPVYAEGEWTRVFSGTFNGSIVPGLYLGGLNWVHPAASDLDADGDADLVVGSGAGRLILYRNVGVPGTPEWRFESDGYAGVEADGWLYPLVGDLNADLAPDLLVGTGNGQARIYYNRGGPAEPSWPVTADVSLAAGWNASPALDDLDGDGYLDILVGHEGGTLVHYENTGSTTDPVWSLRTDAYAGISETGGGLQPALVDLDWDGDRDLVVGLCGQVVWYERGGTAANPSWVRRANDPIGYGGGSCGTSPSAADWDHDGDLDLLTGEHWGDIRLFANTGEGWEQSQFAYPFELAGDTAPALGDWDNDGDLDLLVGQVHGVVEAFANHGSTSAPDWRPAGEVASLPWTDHPHAFPTLADVDGDGDLDLIVGEGGWQGPGAGGNLHLYRNDGTPAEPSWVFVTGNWLGIDVGGWSVPTFGDLDGDNDLDLLIGDEEGTLTLVQNVGTPTAPIWATPVYPYAGLDLGSYSAPTLVDLDQDDDLDLMVGLEHGSVSLVRNSGTVVSPTWELVYGAHPMIEIGERAVPAAADLDGDGEADLLLGDGDGGLDLFVNAGAGEPPVPGAPYQPGDLLRVEGRLRLYGPAITGTTDLEAISVWAGMRLLMTHRASGQPLPAENYFMSTVLAPTGLPIQGGRPPDVGIPAEWNLGPLSYLGGHAVEAELTLTARIPDDLPPGRYRPAIAMDFQGVPTSTQWLAANVTYHTWGPNEAPLPPVVVGEVAEPRLAWRLLMDDLTLGTRGVAAREDGGLYEVASQIASQGAAFAIPPHDVRSSQAITYRLEPFLPMISYTDRRMPTPPLIPFDLPGGDLQVVVRLPDGSVVDLGGADLKQSFNRTKTTRHGLDLNVGTVQLDDVYSLVGWGDQFRVQFEQWGHHVISMTGAISDVWGTTYRGGGTYDVWVALPLDIDPGLLPGTPLGVGDALDPAVQLTPRVPAWVTMTFTLFPDSDPALAISRTVVGQANGFGTFSWSGLPITATAPGEYRLELVARHAAPDGQLYMGALVWGGVVMTPPGAADLVAHGRRGLDSLATIPGHWYLSSELSIPAGAVSHSWNPYYNGDLFWSRMSDGPVGGDSLLIGASVQDTVGLIEAAVSERAQRQGVPLAGPGDLAARLAVGEIPLFISTLDGSPAQWHLGQVGGDLPEQVDQIAYSYRSSQRPGVRVREVVSEDGQNGGYWRLDTLYDDQPGVGVLGDQVNDFKFQYVGTVYRDLTTGHNEYAGQGSGWVFIPDDDAMGSRVMPPFAGYGGWDPRGGPILTLKGEEIDIFVLPTGVRPGAVLEVGDVIHFAGHVMPTLDSRIAVTVTAPSGAVRFLDGRANSVGYFYDPAADLVADEPGLWAVQVRVWHDGLCSGGQLWPPYPEGDVLGTEQGLYWFYVVRDPGDRLDVRSPAPGLLAFPDGVVPIEITGTVPAGWTDVTLDTTVSMPGYVLQHETVAVSGDVFETVVDPAAWSADYPNLDLIGRDDHRPGLADTFSIGLLLRGIRDGFAVERAGAVTIQGDQVAYLTLSEEPLSRVFLPLMIRGG